MTAATRKSYPARKSYYKVITCPKCGHEFLPGGSTEYKPFLSDGIAADTVRKNITGYINRACDLLKLSVLVKDRAHEYSKKLWLRRSPRVMVGGCVYVAACVGSERRTQRDVADALNITEVSIRAGYKEVCKQLNLELEL